MSYLITFIIFWVLFIIIGNSQHWSKTISIGGGVLFAFACIILISVGSFLTDYRMAAISHFDRREIIQETSQSTEPAAPSAEIEKREISAQNAQSIPDNPDFYNFNIKILFLIV